MNSYGKPILGNTCIGKDTSMDIDISKIKVGDEVVARFRVDRHCHDGVIGDGAYAYARHITEHIPAPVVFKVGDKVNIDGHDGEWRVVFQGDGLVWVRKDQRHNILVGVGFVSPCA